AWRRGVQIVWRCGCAMAALLIWVAFGERSAIIAVIFIPFALYVSMRPASRRTLFRWAPALLVLFVVVAGPLGLLMKSKIVTPPQIINMGTSTWDSMEFSVAAEQNYHVRDLFWGRSYMSDVVYTWYPRALFPRKPKRYGIVLIQDLMAPQLAQFPGTFPVGILVEAYANFWYAGLVLVPMCLAIAYRAIYFKLHPSSFFWLVLMAILFQQLGSFRGLGAVFAGLEAQLLVLGLMIAACQLARVFPFSLLVPRLRSDPIG